MALPVPGRLSLVLTRTWSTTSCWGNTVLPSGSPGQYPPTARLRIRKNGLLNTHCLPPRSAGVRRWYTLPSTDQVTESGAQSTAKVWKASANAWPPGSVYAAPMPPEPE